MVKSAEAKRPRRVLASVARAQLAELLEAVGDGGERVLIERRGKPSVALISVDALQQLELLEARWNEMR